MAQCAITVLESCRGTGGYCLCLNDPVCCSRGCWGHGGEGSSNRWASVMFGRRGGFEIPARCQGRHSRAATICARSDLASLWPYSQIIKWRLGIELFAAWLPPPGPVGPRERTFVRITCLRLSGHIMKVKRRNVDSALTCNRFFMEIRVHNLTGSFILFLYSHSHYNITWQ